ncbi:MAG: hypothetical protein IPJ77_04610 [Planctomycetes bacterium]|nr:hypothetical protein [Planctomycetota bacterium]
MLRTSLPALRSWSRPLRALGGVAFALASATIASADVVTFYDGTFGAPWFSAKVTDTTPGALATFASVTTLGDGLLPPCRETTHTFSNGAIEVVHVDTSANYNPADAAICSIDFAFDGIHYPSPAGGAVRYSLLISQAGSYYKQTLGTDVFVGPWTSYISVGILPQGFTKLSGPGPAIPDFSCSGGLMTFGFVTGNSAGGGPWTKVSALDNWLVTLNVAKQTFSDGSFGGPWSSTKILDTTAGASATFGTVVQPVAGNPGAYREVSHTFSTGAIAVAHFDPTNTYDPSTMPVYEVDCSYDLRHFTPALGAVRYYVAVLQGGNYFVAPFDDIFPNTWTSFTHTGLAASDFDNYLGGVPAHPDFTATGAIFQLGYITSNSVTGGPITKFSGIDNWTVVLRQSPHCSQVTGTGYCFGDGTGTPCPCTAGGVGRGCPNSIFPTGALLIAQGTASLSNDTVALKASAMPNSSCVYFQGTSTNNLQSFDGLVCVAGNVIRLGTKTNVCNSSQFPDATNPTVSVRGGVTAPGVRYYQVWYRNPANFCTPATSNYTNGLAITWVP